MPGGHTVPKKSEATKYNQELTATISRHSVTAALKAHVLSHAFLTAAAAAALTKEPPSTIASTALQAFYCIGRSHVCTSQFAKFVDCLLFFENDIENENGKI